jgi:hypothetical protein
MADSALQYFCRITLDDHGFQAQTSNLYLANHATLDQGAWLFLRPYTFEQIFQVTDSNDISGPCCSITTA